MTLNQALERTGKVLGEFCRCYKEQFGVALFNSVRYEIEGAGGPQAQLLHRKVPLEDHVIYSGNIFQYIEENKKWRNRFCVVPHNYGLVLYENKLAYEREQPPRVLVNSAGYKVLTSVEQYLELVNNSLPGVTPKSGHSPILKCPTDFPLVLWHPYARHYYFCVMTGKEQEKWRAVFQDCVRHCNNGISEDSRVEAPAFTDAIRMYRQSKEQYGTWDMLCGNETQVGTAPPNRAPRGHSTPRGWNLLSLGSPSAVHTGGGSRTGPVTPELARSTTSSISSISSTRSHLHQLFQAALVDHVHVHVGDLLEEHLPCLSKALARGGHQGLQDGGDVGLHVVTDTHLCLGQDKGWERAGMGMVRLLCPSSPSHHIPHPPHFPTWLPPGRAEQRVGCCPPAQLQPPLPAPRGGLAEVPQPGSARSPLSCPSVSPAVKEAAVQRKHNLYRDSMVMHNSDPNLHLLGEGLPIDWSEEYSGQPEEPAAERRRRAKQVVSVIQDDEGALPYGAQPGVPPSPPDAVQEIREALAQQSLEDGARLEERLMNGTEGSGASEEGVLLAGGATQQGPARDGDGVSCATAAAPAPGAEVPSGMGRERVTPASSPVPGAEVPSGADKERVTPASSPVPGAEVPSGAGTRRPAPAPPVPGAEVSSGGQCATAALSPVPGAEVPSGTGRRPAPASPVPRADVPAEAEVPPVTPRSSVPASPVSAADVPSGAEVPHVTPRSSMPASPVPRADVPSEAEVPHVTPRSSVPAYPVPRADVPSVPSVPHGTAAPASPRAGVPAEAEVSHVPAEAEVPRVTAAPPGGQSPSAACHLHGDKEPGEPRGITESGEGVQTEF
uniref:Niban apoptosis regulator 2 n=1 Tax=Junco hyemalis TaxID=40217 RepID=A0A8C5JFD7_JUNHY